jgi:arabinoxylan arabinofuranohydrolase
MPDPDPFLNLPAQMITLLMKHRIAAVKVLLFATAVYGHGQNPFITDQYSADPSAHVFEGRMYVYPSHDRDSSVTFDMTDYHVCSSENLVDWTDHGVALSLEDISWAREKAWAPDCGHANGKYYFYFPTDQFHIGVAVSDSPAGPFKDPIGRPLISRDSPGVVSKRDFIDPCVFIDDDGIPYLFFGQLDINVIRLNNDMIYYDGPVRIIEGAKDFFEAVWVHKYKGRYYLSYSTRGERGVTGPQIVYAISDNVLGPYEYQGVILDEVSSGTNHHSIVKYKGRWYLFYHNSDLFMERTPEDSPEMRYRPFRRSICVDHLRYNEDGTIQKVIPTKVGVEAVK